MLPICEKLLSNSALDNEEYFTMDHFYEYIGSDCWAVITFKNGVEKVRYNTYALFDKIGRTCNTKSKEYIKNDQYEAETEERERILNNIENFMEERNDEIHLYMFGEEVHKIICKYHDNNKYSVCTYIEYSDESDE